MTLHSATCLRQNAPCAFPGCGRVFRKGSAEEAAHAHCPACAAVVATALLPQHAALLHPAGTAASGAAAADDDDDAAAQAQQQQQQQHTCPNAGCTATCATLRELHVHCTQLCPALPIQCRFCEEWVLGGGACPWGTVDSFLGLCAHEAACGSKTVRCADCGRAVVSKLWAQHRIERHGEEGGAVAGRPRAGSGDSAGSEVMGRVVEEGGGGGVDGVMSTAGGGGASSTAAAAAAAAAPAAAALPVPLMLLCANSCCSYKASGAPFGFCERCAPKLGPLVGGDDKAALLRGFYQRQFREGCGQPACKNPCCGLVLGGSSSSAVSGEGEEALLKHLLSITTLYACVEDHGRLVIPPLPQALQRPKRGAAPAAASASLAGGGRRASSRESSKKNVAREMF